MNSETKRAAPAVISSTAAGLTRLSVAVLFVLFGWVSLAHANAAAASAALVAQVCADQSGCDGLPDTPAPSKLMCGLAAVGDGNDPNPTALPADSGERLRLRSFDATTVSSLAAAPLPDGRKTRLFDSRGPPRRA